MFVEMDERLDTGIDFETGHWIIWVVGFEPKKQMAGAEGGFEERMRFVLGPLKYPILQDWTDGKILSGGFLFGHYMI